jgi:hypothetical protein
MKKLVLVVGLLGGFSCLFGCAYGGLATSGDKVVVLRNGLFSNTAYVCHVGDNGVTGCAADESP